MSGNPMKHPPARNSGSAEEVKKPVMQRIRDNQSAADRLVETLKYDLRGGHLNASRVDKIIHDIKIRTECADFIDRAVGFLTEIAKDLRKEHPHP